LDVIETVTRLLELKVGDPYRLEHIKQSFVDKKTLWESDSKYLEYMKKRYLDNIKIKIKEHSENETFEDSKDLIHCWKCGNQNSIKANFCMNCGTTLFEVGVERKSEEQTSPKIQKSTQGIGIKIPIIIGIVAVVIAIAGVAATNGYFDVEIGSTSNSVVKNVETEKSTVVESSTESNSKCGKGTVFDPDTNSCVLPQSIEESSTESNSKCGKGTVFDPDTNSCLLEK